MLKYEKGRIVTGQVTGVEKYGIFISLDEFYSGLIHISQISDGYVKDINKYVNIGETIKAQVMEVEEKSYHVKLSIKNINYKLSKRKYPKLKEVSDGFIPLEKQIPNWMNQKLEEYKFCENTKIEKNKKNQKNI